MKKIILALAVAAVATMTIVGYASAGVERCEASVTTGTTITTAKFTALQPKDTTGQFTNVWKHDYTVIVNSDNTFSGNGIVLHPDGSVAWTESIKGSFNADKTVSFDTIPNAGATFKVVNALYDTPVIATSTWDANIIEFMISSPTFSTDTTTTPGAETVKNHGQFVKALGGGKIAAQACAGMPLNSTQGK